MVRKLTRGVCVQHVTRNIAAMSGLRVLADPIKSTVKYVSGSDGAGAELAGDLCANIVAACISMPLHQMYNYTVTSPQLWSCSASDKTGMLKEYLREQYLVTTESGGQRSVRRLLYLYYFPHTL